MIKTKSAFIILIILLIFIFPYWILFLCFNSDSLSSVVTGWNITIYPIGEFFKFLTLLLVTYFYWKLSKVATNIDFKKYFIYFILTIPGVLIISFDLSDLFHFNTNNHDAFMQQINMIIFIKITINILFYIGQILFLVYYYKIIKTKIS